MDIDMEDVFVQEQLTTPHTSSYSPECYYKSVSDGDDKPSLFNRHSKPFDDTRQFIEELEYHKRNGIWGFQYGEEVARKTNENVLAYQEQLLGEHSSFNSETQEDTPYFNTNQFTPLPPVSWADNREVWQTMMRKEEVASSKRKNRLFENPSSLLVIMRAVLIDWLMEVSHTYQLKRVTLYLAVDYIDRFLTTKPSVPKRYLQLVGITSLFIAAKVEEIYPPKLKALCTLCDGACKEEDILNCEMLLLNTMGWEVNSMTPPEWLNIYMQIHCDVKYINHKNVYRDRNSDFMIPHYSGHEFIHLSNLIDLFVLDPGFVHFKYSVIAASAISIVHGAAVAYRVSGLTRDDLKACIDYMTVYYIILCQSDEPQHRIVVPCTSCDYCNSVIETYNFLNCGDIQLIMSETFLLQTYFHSLKYFEKAIILRLEQMGYYACQVHQNIDEEDYEKLYEIRKISNFNANYVDTFDSIFCFSNSDIFNAKTTVAFPKIVKEITECAHRKLISRRIK